MAPNSGSAEQAGSELAFRVKIFRESLSSQAAALLDQLLLAAADQMGKSGGSSSGGLNVFLKLTLQTVFVQPAKFTHGG